MFLQTHLIPILDFHSQFFGTIGVTGANHEFVNLVYESQREFSSPNFQCYGKHVLYKFQIRKMNFEKLMGWMVFKNPKRFLFWSSSILWTHTWLP